jgi:hypothetical protein
MTDALPQPTIVAVKFGFSDKTYDFFSDIPVEIGQRVYVETSRGETKATIVDIKNESDRAERSVLRIVEPETPPSGEAA